MESNQQTILILGGDGYLGWSLGLAFGHRTNLKVVLADNLIKRTWEKQIGAKLLVPLASPTKRIAEYERIFGKTNLSFEKVDLLNQDAVAKLIKKYRPFAVVNAAQQPSAPFSMMSPEGAAATFSNNIIGHLNTAWAIAEIDKNITYIKLGSAGCYSNIDTDFVPLKKADFTFTSNGKQKRVVNSWMPMRANDFYHQSKIADFHIDDLASDVWRLRIATVQQATIFGATIEENRDKEFHALSTRFNYDETFGTVINRFVCQIAIDHPMTIYGDGEQRTGTISLPDTVDNFLNLVNTDIHPGEHTIIHNFTDRLSIKEIAEMLFEASGYTKVSFLENPRKETAGGLRKEIERHPVVGNPRKASQELTALLEFTKRYKDNIDPSLIMPKVKWERGNAPSAATAAKNRIGEAYHVLTKQAAKIIASPGEN
jgi:UDP-sulfoquinovose synthase